MTLPLLFSCLDIDLQQIASEVVSDALEAARTNANFIITRNNVSISDDIRVRLCIRLNKHFYTQNTEMTREESSASAMDLEKPKLCDKTFVRIESIFEMT